MFGVTWSSSAYSPQYNGNGETLKDAVDNLKKSIKDKEKACKNSLSEFEAVLVRIERDLTN